jgi:hypothetical protein
MSPNRSHRIAFRAVAAICGAYAAATLLVAAAMVKLAAIPPRVIVPVCLVAMAYMLTPLAVVGYVTGPHR